MARFRDINLSRYCVSPITGFLPESPPLERLPDPYYDPWEDTVLDLPQLIASDALKDKLDSLPTLSTTKLDTEEEWRRAYVVLSFLSQGYIWSGNKPRRELPISIVAPLRKVSEYLAINPCGTFAAYCLWNIASNPTFGNERSNPDDFVSLCTFTGSKEEEWFYVISVAIEAQGGRLISQMLDAIDAVHENDASRVQSFLEAFITCVDGISATLSRLNENLSQGFFYHRLRPFLRGSRNMARTGLPDGIYYPRCQCQGGEGEWLAYSGGSNAQSSLIQLMDIILGIDHDVEFIKDMRSYMPGPHREFLELMKSASNIRAYALSHRNVPDVQRVYNEAVSRLGALRDNHIRVVARYIFIPAGKECPLNGCAHMQESERGTGGTDIMQFLRTTRDTTKLACCEGPKASTAKETCPTCRKDSDSRSPKPDWQAKIATLVIKGGTCERGFGP